MKRSMVLRYAATGIAALGVCLATGCVATDTVSSRFPTIEANIDAAKTAGAAEYAPTPLTLAEAKLAAAKSAVSTGEMAFAAKLADEAMADADYARVKAPTEKTKNDAMQLRADIQILRDEIKKMSTGN